MSLANGRTYLAIPGPSVVPDQVLQAMHQASPNIYEGPVVDLVPGIIDDLKAVARTKYHAAIYISNGHGVWEAAIANTLNAGDTALLLMTGAFGRGWGEISTCLGVKLQVIDAGRKNAIDLNKVRDALSVDRKRKIKAVMVCQVDTSTSVLNDIPALRAVIDDVGHPALLMVDCVASLGCDQFEMDAWGVDLVVAASQKGFMTPPGMGFLFFNDKADLARGNCTNVSWYWDWRPRLNPQEFYMYFGGTAPTQHLFGLRVALDMILDEGLAQVWHRHRVLAQAYWAAIDAWGQTGPIKLNISDPVSRSCAVTTVSIGLPYGAQLRDWVIDNAGLTLGISLAMDTPDDPKGSGVFRIGHMGHVNAHMVLGSIGVIEAAMLALDIPHAKGGLAAAVAVCAKG